MSEESSSDGGETIVLHQPQWRSNSRFCFLTVWLICSPIIIISALIAYLKELNTRVLAAQDSGVKNKHVPQRKQREIGPAKESAPPAAFPKWTVSTDWLKGA